MNWIESEKEIEVLPRFAFKKKFSNINGAEVFDVAK